MAQKSVLQCDKCGKQCDEKQAVNWLKVSAIGRSARSCSDILEGDFCSAECVYTFFAAASSVMEAQEKARTRAPRDWFDSAKQPEDR